MNALLTFLRWPLCRLALCQTFRPAADETGCWGECGLCGKRTGFVDRAALRSIADHEVDKIRKAAK